MINTQLVQPRNFVQGTATCTTQQDGSLRIEINFPASAAPVPTTAQPMAPPWHILERMLQELQLEEPC